MDGYILGIIVGLLVGFPVGLVFMTWVIDRRNRREQQFRVDAKYEERVRRLAK